MTIADILAKVGIQPRNFHQMLAMEFRRLVIDKGITQLKFKTLVIEYMMTKPKVTRAMMYEKLIQRLSADHMSVKTFRVGLRVLNIDDYQASLEIHIKAEGLPFPKDTARIQGSYQISDDFR